MAEKKISPREFYERMKAMRNRPHKPELIEKFNKIMELDEQKERERQIIVSTDFDIGYAVLASKELKDVVIPDSVARRYRDYHFC